MYFIKCLPTIKAFLISGFLMNFRKEPLISQRDFIDVLQVASCELIYSRIIERLNFLYYWNKILLSQMGGSESSLEIYVRQHGPQALFKLLLLKRQISWLQQSCVRQINRKIDDQIKYILFQMDQFVNEKKEQALQKYKKTKSQIMLKESYRVKNCQQKHGKSLQNIYGKNNLLDKLNLLKINFHVEVHIAKKRVKKSIGQKITSIENQTFVKLTDQIISRTEFEGLLKDNSQYSHLVQQNSQIDQRFERFKSQVIGQLDFNKLFWPQFDVQIRQTQQEVVKVYNEVEKNTKSMRKDLQGNWNLFKFQST